MKPEELLHLFAPYLPTDRFRALLRNHTIPATSQGAALLVDIVGFTPMTTRYVTEYGPERACEELKRRLNPMLEAIAGQVFHHGGSVIRFTGDGFIAWFDDQPVGYSGDTHVSALMRAVAAGLEMQAVMPLFRGLQLKVCVAKGTAHRWVVGQPQYGLTDVLSGPAVDAVSSLVASAQPDQVLVHDNAIPDLRREQAQMELNDNDSAVVTAIPEAVSKAARLYRWPAWRVEGNIDDVLNAVRPFVASTIRERVESGFGDFVAELRHALPMFIQVALTGSDIQAALNSYIGRVQDVLSNAGGRLVSVEFGEKGSVLFAVFGAPIAYGDDADRVVRAALTLRDVAAQSDSIATQRIGISWGMLYAGTIGGEARHEYTTIGDETNIASRLMSAAAFGQILVSSAARAEVSSRIAFQELSPLAVKGKAKPIAVCEPLAIVSGNQPQTYTGELVGREVELDRLHQSLEAVRAGHPRIVRIEGQAGIGKSRLVAQLALVAAEHKFRILTGDCLGTGRNIPYLPWQNMLAELLALPPQTGAAESLTRLADLVRQANPDWLPRLPLLGELLNLPTVATPTTTTLESHTRRQALFALVTDLILHAARQQPTLLIFEDAQWLDEVSEALLIDLTRRLTVDPAPLLLLIVHRPPESGDLQGLIDALSETPNASQLIVRELSSANVTTMIERYVHARVPPELATFIYERAHGNPLFVHEMIDTLTETGHVRVIGNMAFVERDLQSANLSQTIQGLVQARVDRLDETDKLVLKVASVIGREFPVRVLASSIPVQISGDELRERLRKLEDRDFLQQQTPDPELTYSFRYAVTQDVVYQTLLLAQRQQLHLEVAITLETMFPDTVERLAYHFSRSGEARRTRYYLLLAGQKALREYANQAALDYLTQALPLAISDQDRFDINHQRLQLMLRQGDMQRVQDELPAMRELAERYYRPDWRAIVHLLSANYYMQTSAWAWVINEGQKAIAAAQQIGDDVLTWEAALLLRDAFLRINQREEANALSELMEPLVKHIGDTRQSIQFALLQLDDLYDKNPVQSIRKAHATLTRAQNLGDPALEAACWSALTTFYSRVYDLPAALDAARNHINLLRQIGDRRGEGLALNRIGITLVNLGQFSEGNKHLLDAYKILRQIGERSGEAISFVYLGIIAEHYKAHDEALAYMNRGLVIQRELDLDTDLAFTLFHIGNVNLARNDLNEAVKAFDEARSLLEANGLPHQISEIYTALSEIDMRREDRVAAKAHVAPLLSRLAQRQLNGLMLPGLAYWRSIQVLERVNDMKQAAQLREAFQAEVNAILDRLVDPRWRDAYINGIWYHAALFKNDHVASAQG